MRVLSKSKAAFAAFGFDKWKRNAAAACAATLLLGIPVANAQEREAKAAVTEEERGEREVATATDASREDDDSTPKTSPDRSPGESTVRTPVTDDDEPGGKTANTKTRERASAPTKRLAPPRVPKAPATLQPNVTTAQTLGSTVVPTTTVAYVPGFIATLSLMGEVDTNARRVAIDPKAPVNQNPEVVADALMRGQLSLAGALVRPKQRFNLRLDAGGKMFAALATERMGVAQLQSNVDVVVAPAVAFYGRLFSKVRAQVSLARSYTIHRADVGASIAVWGPFSIRPSIYGAGFHGVGTPQFSSAASGLGLGGSARLTAQERIDLSGDMGLRVYPFAYPVDDEGNIAGPISGRRVDAPFRATLSFSSARLLFLNVSYTILRNASNSFGESFTRHRLRALVGARLPALVTLSAQGSLQVTTYDQGVSVGQRLFLADDDESQNVLQIKLSRPLLEGIAIEGRVAFFGNELAREGVRFSRTTLSIGLRANL